MGKLLRLSREQYNRVVNGRDPVSRNTKAWLELLENESKHHILREDSANSPAEQCRRYFDQLLQACHGDPSRLFWVLEQLRIHLPLNRWASQDAQPTDEQLTEAAISGLAQIGGKLAMKSLGLPEKPKDKSE